MTRALVLGGSGTVGAEVVRLLAPRLPTAFTYLTGATRADELARATDARALCVDLRDPAATREAARASGADVLVHCAAVARFVTLGDLDDNTWDVTQAVACRAPFIVCRELRETLRSVVLVGAMDRAQSLPLPVHVAAAQGMMSGMTVALAKEFAGRCFVNMVALGPLDAGLSRDLSPKLMEDYHRFSALRRLGTPVEAARAIVWLALENRYMNGKVLSVNGGI